MYASTPIFLTLLLNYVVLGTAVRGKRIIMMLKVELPRKIYIDIATGRLPGLIRDLAEGLRDDRLSPGLRDHLLDLAKKTFIREYARHRNIKELEKIIASRVNDEWMKIVERVKPLVETYKPRYIPPLMIIREGISFRLSKNVLSAEEVGCWIEEKPPYTFITYWYKFPYDLYPGDGAEYEPWTIVLKNGKVVEYQARSHWRLVHIHPKLVLHDGKRPIIAFTDFAHTPAPVLNLNVLASILNVPVEEVISTLNKYCYVLIGFLGEGGIKPIIIEERIGREMGDLLPLRTYIEGLLSAQVKYYMIGFVPIFKEYEVSVHIGPSRVRPPPHNPLREKWYGRPLFDEPFLHK